MRRRRRSGLGRRNRASRRERLVLAQNCGLEVTQVLAGLQAQLLLEHPATRLVRVQRVRLPARAVEREHQLAAKSLAVGMLGDQRLELRHECGITAEDEVGVDPLLERSEPQLLQLCDGGGRERLGSAAPGAGRPARA